MKIQSNRYRYVTAYGLILGFVCGFIAAGVGVFAFPSFWRGGSTAGAPALVAGAAFFAGAAAVAYCAVEESLPKALRRTAWPEARRLVPTVSTRRPGDPPETAYFSRLKWIVSGALMADAYGLSIFINYCLWKRLMSYAECVAFAFAAFLISLPAVRLVTRRLGAIAAAKVALASYLTIHLMICVAPARSPAGRALVWCVAPLVGSSAAMVPAFQSLLHAQLPVEGRSQITAWYKALAIGVPRALGAGLGGAALGAAIRADRDASSYAVGLAPHAPAIALNVLVLAAYARLEATRGHESKYVYAPARTLPGHGQ